MAATVAALLAARLRGTLAVTVVPWDEAIVRVAPPPAAATGTPTAFATVGTRAASDVTAARADAALAAGPAADPFAALLPTQLPLPPCAERLPPPLGAEPAVRQRPCVAPRQVG